MGESSAVLSPANRRVHSNPFGSLPPKPYGLPDRHDPDLSWFALIRRHQFLLFMLAILTFLCTIYLYFAITMGTGDACAGLQGTERASCNIARTKAGLGHRRLQELSEKLSLQDHILASRTAEMEQQPLQQGGKGRSGARASADLSRKRGEFVTLFESLLGERGFRALRKVMDMSQGARSFSAVVENFPARLFSHAPTVSKGDSHNWCNAFPALPQKFDLVHGSGVISSQMSRCEIGDILFQINRIVRNGGYVLIWDTAAVVERVQHLAPSLGWQEIAHRLGRHGQDSLVALVKPAAPRAESS